MFFVSHQFKISLCSKKIEIMIRLFELVLYIMSTIHLQYSSLEKVFDNINEQRDITLLIRNSKFKLILNECSLFPKVIDDIICNYINTKKATCKSKVRIMYDSLFCISKYGHYTIQLTVKFKHICAILMLKIPRCDDYLDNASYSMTIDPLSVSYYDQIIHMLNSNCDHSYEYIQLINTYMEHVYNTIKYIDCPMQSEDDSSIFFIKKNAIVHMTDNEITGIRIKKHRLFKYFIVTMKCIINGVQRYFRENYIEEYLKQINKE